LFVAAETMIVRSVFIIDPNKKSRLSLNRPASAGCRRARQLAGREDERRAWRKFKRQG